VRSETRATDPRTRYYRLLAVGKRQLGMDEETYRAFLAAHGAGEVAGRVSATAMDFGALVAAVEALRRQGFKPRRKTVADGHANWRAPRIAKITALWCALADAGAIRDRSERAMLKFCAGQTGTARIQWATGAGLNRCIEALKSWAGRERVTLDGDAK